MNYLTCTSTSTIIWPRKINDNIKEMKKMKKKNKENINYNLVID